MVNFNRLTGARWSGRSQASGVRMVISSAICIIQSHKHKRIISSFKNNLGLPSLTNLSHIKLELE